MTDFRALCEELLDELELWSSWHDATDLKDRAGSALHFALAEQPVVPTDEALANFSGWFCRNYPGPDTIIHKPEWHAPKVFRAAANAIARWGTSNLAQG